MRIIENLRPWLGRKSVRGALVVLVIIVIALVLTGGSADDADETVDTEKALVEVTTPIQYVGGQSLSLIGNVRAFTEAAVTSERAGRVVSVNVTLGQSVSAGTVIATLENASERATVLQAEGVYDAAVAAAAQSGVGVDQAETALSNAKNAAVSAYKSAYNTTNGVVVNSIDAFFADPNKQVPGLKIDGRGFAGELNAERVVYQSLLPTWQSRVNSISAESDLKTELEYSKQNVQRTINLVDTFLVIFSQQENSSRYTEAELLSFQSTFTGLRSSLIGVQSSLDNSMTALDSAAESLQRAKLSATGGENSAADAQVKQALGSLRGAQANLAKTILRTPISGTVNSLSLRTGDFVNSFAQVAVVANNDALEIVTYVSDNERELISEGDTVVIEGKYEGRVTEIAPAVSSVVGKTEVRIATEGTDITNGDTVTVVKEVQVDDLYTNTVRVPLTAIKFEREDGSIFAVVDGVLVSKAVILGDVLGGSVEVVEGLSANEQFVVDVRGLIAGEEAEVKE